LPTSLDTIAFIYVLLSIAACLFVAADIFVMGRRQPMKVMEAVWPLTLLYWGPLGLPFYLSFGRGEPGGMHMHDDVPMWQAVFNGSAHCGAGCALGDFAAEWIVLGLGLALFGSALAARLSLSFALAYAAGVAFQYYAIAPMRSLGFRAGVAAAVKADTLSLIAYEVGMFAFMIYRAHAWSGLQPTEWSYWLMIQIAMVCGFFTTYPVNWLLIRTGVKERM
jgi:Domain of unknown function (DUF4396)